MLAIHLTQQIAQQMTEITIMEHYSGLLYTSAYLGKEGFSVSNPYTGDIENPSLPKQAERKIEYHPGNWTRQEVNDNPDVLYVCLLYTSRCV